TIQNDDAQAVLSINDVSQAEGNSGTTAFTFTVTLTGATAVPVSVDFATASGTAIGNTSCAGRACGSPAYLSQSGTLNFQANTTVQTQTIDVLVCGDTTFELAETFTVNLSNASNATIAKGTGTGTIQNDDAQAVLSINDVSHSVGNCGTPGFPHSFPPTLFRSVPVSVDFATASGTAIGN